ncbi:hypothetical protein [Iodobacter fluviatilis]|jgi:hypothetical protein|uniref:Tryptophan synthase subunit beta like protein n=1 Tax=Iodobacter fluviatilis TaxID=537 RepID=A0A7G3G7B2_9NEIS|nr:hypothetical protein [Iodobacter fluviatilis]QBC42725.1 hypothetical protein C1H71_03590 [Iodobacter fluviatilis]
MPYISRDPNGQITAIFRDASPEANQFIPQNAPELLSFIGAPANTELFHSLDSDLIRVIEDVIDALIHKKLLLLTDLPAEAQTKILARRNLRQNLPQSSSILAPRDGLIWGE